MADVTGKVKSERALAQEMLPAGSPLTELMADDVVSASDEATLALPRIPTNKLLKSCAPAKTPRLSSLAVSRKRSSAASLLTRQMLAYSGRGKFVVEPVNLSQIVHEFLPLISRSLSPAVSIDLVLAEDLPSIECDRAQMAAGGHEPAH